MTSRRAFGYAVIALVIGALAHILAYVLGPHAIGFLGAPPEIVQSAIDGTWPAPVSCFAIAAFLLWLAYLMWRLAKGYSLAKITRIFLWAMAIVFILRGLLLVMFVPAIMKWSFGTEPAKFWFLFAASVIVLTIGQAMAIGLSKTAYKNNKVGS